MNTGLSSQERRDLVAAVQKIARSLDQVGRAADWIGPIGDGHSMGVLEANGKAHEEAINSAAVSIAEALREGLHEIAEAIGSRKS